MKKIFWGIIFILLAGLIAYAIYYRIKSKQSEENKPAKSGAALIAVETVRPQHRTIQDKRIFSGSLKPWTQIEIAPKVSGRLEKLYFDIGDRIENGQTIAVIDSTEYRQLAAQAAADLEVAKAQLQEAKVNLDLKQKDFERQQELFSKKATSDAQFDLAESAYKAQAATYQMKQSEVLRRQAILDNAQLKVSDCTIKAEWDDGHPRYVGLRNCDEGSLIQANKPLLTIAEIDRLMAVIYVIERDYPMLKIDAPAKITTDAYPGVPFQGKVRRIAQLLQDSTRQGEVKLEIENSDLKLKPGMFVRVELVFSEKPDALVIPKVCLVRRNDNVGVFTVDGKELKAVFTPVQTGITGIDSVEILSPDLNLPVVTLGNHLLNDGSKVVIPEISLMEKK